MKIKKNVQLFLIKMIMLNIFYYSCIKLKFEISNNDTNKYICVNIVVLNEYRSQKNKFGF